MLIFQTGKECLLILRSQIMLYFFIFFAPLALPYKTGFLFPEKCAIIGADIPNCSDMEVRYEMCIRDR